jgi:transitional endoplasmic reticulum ATPase
VIPIGLPDEDARLAIWQRYVPAVVADGVDFALLVERTAGFSPADIEYAARKASQSAFEKAIAGGTGAGAPHGPHTADYLEAIGATRPTVSPETAAEFLEDIELLARV